jgi:dihydrofolate reductase
MRKSIVVAMDQKNGIGYQNRLPWHLPDELKRFKALTMGHHLIMGRKTYESIGRALPGRTTIILTHNPEYQPGGCLVAHSVPQAFRLVENRGESEVFICGGEAIYRETLRAADRLYLTRVHAKFQTDTSFPDFDVSLWAEISADFHSEDEKNPYPYTIYIYERKKPDA